MREDRLMRLMGMHVIFICVHMCSCTANHTCRQTWWVWWSMYACKGIMRLLVSMFVYRQMLMDELACVSMWVVIVTSRIHKWICTHTRACMHACRHIYTHTRKLGFKLLWSWSSLIVNNTAMLYKSQKHIRVFHWRAPVSLSLEHSGLQYVRLLMW
jgi:hypothetical protein